MRILIATGGSAHSEIAERMTATLAAAVGAQVTLLTIAVSERGLSQAESIALHSASTIRQLAGDVESKVTSGRTADKIVQELQRNDYDLLIIGERPGHRLIHRILANTVERLMERAPCPVLIARDAGLPLRMLFCESGRRPLVVERVGKHLAQLLDLCREATVLHVMSQIAVAPGITSEDLRMDVATHLRRNSPEGSILRTAREILDAHGISSQAMLRHGRVVDEVIDEASANPYDLVVIGAFRATGWDRFMLSDQAHAILIGTVQPLLVV